MVLPLAALGVSAVSQLYKSATSQSASQTNGTPFQPSADPATPQTSAGSNTLNIPTKLSTDIKALLLSLQSSANGSTGSSTGSTAASASGSGSTASTAAATDPNAAVQADLQNVLGDLQKAGGHHRHHHGGGQPGNDASSTATTPTTTTADTGGTQSSSSANLFSQLSKALNAYSHTAAGTTLSSAGLRTA